MIKNSKEIPLPWLESLPKLREWLANQAKEKPMEETKANEEVKNEECVVCGEIECELCGCHACQRVDDDHKEKPLPVPSDAIVIDPTFTPPAYVEPAKAPEPTVIVRFTRDGIKAEWIVFVQVGTTVFTTNTPDKPIEALQRILGSFAPVEDEDDLIDAMKRYPEQAFQSGCEKLANEVCGELVDLGQHKCTDCGKMMMTVCRGCQESAPSGGQP